MTVPDELHCGDLDGCRVVSAREPCGAGLRMSPPIPVERFNNVLRHQELPSSDSNNRYDNALTCMLLLLRPNT